jgi:hypothetical protein
MPFLSTVYVDEEIVTTTEEAVSVPLTDQFLETDVQQDQESDSLRPVSLPDAYISPPDSISNCCNSSHEFLLEFLSILEWSMPWYICRTSRRPFNLIFPLK